MKSPRTAIAARRVPDIVEAMNSPQLFQPYFPGGASWDLWRAVLRATAALPMSPADIEAFKSVAGGREPPRKRPREAWYICGRRAGKDSVVSLIAAHAAASFNPRGILRPGERALIACIAPDRETGKIVQGYIAAYFQMIASLKAMVQRETDEVLELKNSVDISVMTSNFRLVRGRPILAAILDEVGLMRSGENGVAPDLELYNALTPGMSTIKQAQLFGISTPYAKKGLLYKKYAENFGQDSDDILVVQAPSHVMNPILDTRDRDRQMIDDPAVGRAEWYAEFRTDLVSFIDPATVARCVKEGRVELLPVPTIKYVAAVDPSGGSSDSMTLSLAHAEGDRGVLDLVREWPAPFSPDAVVTEIVEVLRRYSVTSVIGDRYGGQWAQEPFRIRGIQYEVASLTRSEAYLELLPLINSGRVELLDHPRMITQLCSLERRTARSGKDTVDHPHGAAYHDDIINSAALALVGTAQPRSSADNWIEFYRRQSILAGIERDSISAPNFGFAIGPSKRVRVRVPFDVTALRNPSGDQVNVCVDEVGRFADILEDDARAILLSGLPDSVPWRAINQELADRLKPLPRGGRLLAWSDLERAAEDMRSIDPNDKMRMVRETLRRSNI